MYVGDSVEHDVLPPKSLGMVAVWARRGAKPGQETAGARADHVVDDFAELGRILRESYGVRTG